VKPEIASALHAGDERPLYQFLELPYRRGEMTLYEVAMKYVDATKEIEKEIQEFRKLYDEHKGLANGSEDSFYQKMKQAEAKRTVRDNILRRLSTYVAPDLAKRKWAVFDSSIVAQIQANPAQKWLIFNDNANAIEEAASRLKEKEVKYAMLDGGNAAAIQRTIDAYKGGDAQVLLLNSKLEAVGMNLENTTHLLFMHAARPQYVEQIVGRAQRYGRVGKLHIIALFNAGENPAA
jgi:superfamily II DNA/RNA helicase